MSCGVTSPFLHIKNPESGCIPSVRVHSSPETIPWYFKTCYKQRTMAHQINFVVSVLLALLVNISFALPTSDQERCFDKEYNRELINWLISAQYPQIVSSACKYCEANSFSRSVPKRNSELINSLLSLPKNMNDAGK